MHFAVAPWTIKSFLVKVSLHHTTIRKFRYKARKTSINKGRLSKTGIIHLNRQLRQALPSKASGSKVLLPVPEGAFTNSVFCAARCSLTAGIISRTGKSMVDGLKGKEEVLIS